MTKTPVEKLGVRELKSAIKVLEAIQDDPIELVFMSRLSHEYTDDTGQERAFTGPTPEQSKLNIRVLANYISIKLP